MSTIDVIFSEHLVPFFPNINGAPTCKGQCCCKEGNTITFCNVNSLLEPEKKNWKKPQAFWTYTTYVGDLVGAPGFGFSLAQSWPLHSSWE